VGHILISYETYYYILKNNARAFEKKSKKPYIKCGLNKKKGGKRRTKPLIPRTTGALEEKKPKTSSTKARKSVEWRQKVEK